MNGELPTSNLNEEPIMVQSDSDLPPLEDVNDDLPPLEDVNSDLPPLEDDRKVPLQSFSFKSWDELMSISKGGKENEGNISTDVWADIAKSLNTEMAKLKKSVLSVKDFFLKKGHVHLRNKRTTVVLFYGTHCSKEVTLFKEYRQYSVAMMNISRNKKCLDLFKRSKFPMRKLPCLIYYREGVPLGMYDSDITREFLNTVFIHGEINESLFSPFTEEEKNDYSIVPDSERYIILRDNNPVGYCNTQSQARKIVNIMAIEFSRDYPDHNIYTVQTDQGVRVLSTYRFFVISCDNLMAEFTYTPISRMV